eukprot:12967217-Alexandrium_andersonii.AAC.1
MARSFSPGTTIPHKYTTSIKPRCGLSQYALPVGASAAATCGEQLHARPRVAKGCLLPATLWLAPLARQRCC